MKIEITDGYVETRDTLTRKVKKAYKRAIMGDVSMEISTSTGETSDKLEIPVSNIDDAMDALVYGMVEKVVVPEKEIQDTRKFLEEDIEDEDFEKIARECQRLMRDEEVKKKDS